MSLKSRPQTRRYRLGPCECDIVSKPWFIDVLTFALVGVWMALTFATIQQQGTGPWLLGSAVVILLGGLLLVYGQRLSYFQLGDRVIIGLEDDGPAGESEEASEWQRENR
jgi:hypothetical protein